MPKPCRIPEITRQMVISDYHWPQLVLPLKRFKDDGFLESGYLCNPALPNSKVLVFLGNMWAIGNDEDQKLVYENVDALIADGWEVD